MSTHSGKSLNNRRFYDISRNTENEELEFKPPKGSKDLQRALQIAFPEEDSYNARLQRAVLEFYQEQGLQPQELPLERVSPAPSTTSLTRTLNQQNSNLSAGMPSRQGSNPRSGSRPSGKLDPFERRRRHNNRGKVCQYHRRKKTKCTPETCKDNVDSPQYRAQPTPRLEAGHAVDLDAFWATQLDKVTFASSPRPLQLGNPNCSGDWGLDLNLEYQQSMSTSPVHSAYLPPTASVSSLPIMQSISMDSPFTTGLAASFYESGLNVPPTVPSKDHVDTQDQQYLDHSHENSTQVGLGFKSRSIVHPPAILRSVKPAKPEKWTKRVSRSGPLAVIRRSFDMLFEMTSRQKV